MSRRDWVGARGSWTGAGDGRMEWAGWAHEVQGQVLLGHWDDRLDPPQPTPSTHLNHPLTSSRNPRNTGLTPDMCSRRSI